MERSYEKKGKEMANTPGQQMAPPPQLGPNMVKAESSVGGSRVNVEATAGSLDSASRLAETSLNTANKNNKERNHTIRTAVIAGIALIATGVTVFGVIQPAMTNAAEAGKTAENHGAVLDFLKEAHNQGRFGVVAQKPGDIMDKVPDGSSADVKVDPDGTVSVKVQSGEPKIDHAQVEAAAVKKLIGNLVSNGVDVSVVGELDISPANPSGLLGIQLPNSDSLSGLNDVKGVKSVTSIGNGTFVVALEDGTTITG